MPLTLAQAQTQLDLWIAADTAVSKGQSYNIGNRSLSRVDAEEITNKITWWQNQIRRLTNGSSMTSKRAVPRDL